MQCDNCGKDGAAVQWTQIENNEIKTSHLCESCASDKGLSTGASATSAPLADFLAQLGKTSTSETPAPGDCPACGLSLQKLRQAGRVGCATCYRHFEPQLRGLLRRLHGGTQHVGKVVLPPDPDEADRSARVHSLRRSLERAVQAEDFETAARLRDQIRRLREEG